MIEYYFRADTRHASSGRDDAAALLLPAIGRVCAAATRDSRLARWACSTPTWALLTRPLVGAASGH
jgi:hypothetical protein